LIRVKEDWWKDFFNNVYLITDARSVCDDNLTSREVDLIEDILGPGKDARILDLCGGQGRHSIELARRGYRDLTVLDYSSHLIKLGKMLSRKAGVDVRFCRADARCSNLKDEDYSFIIIMANSFGYFARLRDDLLLLREAYRLLKDNGRLLVDLTDPDYVRKKIRPFSWHEANSDIIVLRRRELKGDVVRAREIVISKRKGLIRDGSYRERIYDKKDIIRHLRGVGFRRISVRKGLSLHERKQDYGFLSSRMIVTACK
jgi:D-alanine-D-alanine ligase